MIDNVLRGGCGYLNQKIILNFASFRCVMNSMKKCPNCFEVLKEDLKDGNCPCCGLNILGKVLNLDYPSVDRKKCYFCGKMVAREAIYCRYCHKWLDEVDKMVDDLKDLES